MGDQGHADERTREQQGAGAAFKRRGILAAAGAMVAGMVARQAAEPVSAGLGNGTPINVGEDSRGSSRTYLYAFEANQFVPFVSDVVWEADASTLPNTITGGTTPYNVNGIRGTGKGTGDGVIGYSGAGNGYGVFGQSASGTGTYGQSSGGPATSGVQGRHTGNGYGVYGDASTGGIGVAGIATTALGVYGQSTSGTGVHGQSASGIGTYGQSNGNTFSKAVYGKHLGNGYGVFGEATTTNGYGVHGTVTGGDATARGVNGYTGNYGYGVFGSNTYGIGVHGQTTGGYGVQGIGGAIGVRGESGGGPGVYGTTSATGVVAGVYGTSATAYGVIGNTTAAGYSGLTAITATAGVAALAATSTDANAYAAYFTGTTVVQGTFVAFGGAKSAAVPHPDGSHRLVYCVESPESWFEDFGEARLIGGKADVRLDADFAAVVRTDAYHIFLTPRGDFQVHVAQQTAAGFTVQQTTGAGAAGAGGAFSYRVVARRKDIKGERLAKFAPPKIKTPDPDKLPKPAPAKAEPSGKG